MYTLLSAGQSVVMVALYTMERIWHCPLRGQVSGLWQLQPGSSSLLLLYYSGIVAADDPLEVRHAAVAELDCMSINDLL